MELNENKYLGMNTTHLKSLISQNHLRETLDTIIQYSKNNIFPYHQETLQISARYEALKRDEINGTISYEERSIEQNKISVNLLQLVELIEGWLDSGHRRNMNEETCEGKIDKLAEEFNETKKVKLTPSRLRAKNNLIKDISKLFIQKPQLIEQYIHSEEEGVIAGIAYKIQTVPQQNDLGVLEDIGGKTKKDFVKGVITNALAELVYSGLLGLGDDQRIFQLLEILKKEADVPLLKNIERVEVALTYLIGVLPKAKTEIIFYDEKIKTEYGRLNILVKKEELSPKEFINSLSFLFNRGTFRFETCIKKCNTQKWQRRYISVFDTNRLIRFFLAKTTPVFTSAQRRLLSDLQTTLFKYYDNMGAFLFEEMVDPGKIDEYMQQANFLIEKKFKSIINPGLIEMPKEVVKEINRPLQKSVEVMNELLHTIQEEEGVYEIPYCQDCICDG